MLQNLRAKRARHEGGFTLIELLITIVVVGVLAAVVIIGVSGLTNKGSTSACAGSADAARVAAVVHYSNTSPSAYPTDFSQFTASELSVAPGVTPSPIPANTLQLNGNGWTLTMTPGVGTAAPTFACS